MAGTPPAPAEGANPLVHWVLSPVGAAIILAVAFAAVGAFVFLTVGPVDASTPAQMAATPDLAVHFAGRIDTAWVEGDSSMTHFQFVGAPSVDVRVPGNVLGRFPRGLFVEVSGVKDDGNVTVHSISPASEPLSSSVPFFALASGLAAGLVAHVLFVRVGEKGSPFDDLAARRRERRSHRDAEDGEGGQRDGDNHSGAPAPKS